MGCLCSTSLKNSQAELGLSSSMKNEKILGLAHMSDKENGLHEEYRIGPTSNKFPSWMRDEDAKLCFSCKSQFKILVERKHHCRRCRNIFCDSCTKYKAKILLYEIQEEVRVCNSCYREIPDENSFIQNYQPLLHAGGCFKKSTLMGLSVKLIKLRLLEDNSILIYDSPGSGLTDIELSSILKVAAVSVTAFEIVTVDKTYSLDCDSAETQKMWVEALTIVLQISKAPSLKSKIESSRRSRDGGKSEQVTKKRSEFSQMIKDQKSALLTNKFSN